MKKPVSIERTIIEEYLDTLDVTPEVRQKKKDVLEYYYTLLRRALDTGQYPEVEIVGVGRFVIKRFKFTKYIQNIIRKIRQEYSDYNMTRLKHFWTIRNKMANICAYKKSKLKVLILKEEIKLYGLTKPETERPDIPKYKGICTGEHEIPIRETSTGIPDGDNRMETSKD